MPTVEPLPIEIAVPDIPPEIGPEDQPRWEPIVIPVGIEFPISPPEIVPLTLRITVPGRGTLDVTLLLSAATALASET